MFCRQLFFATLGSDAVNDSQDTFASRETLCHFVFVGQVHESYPQQDKQNSLTGSEQHDDAGHEEHEAEGVQHYFSPDIRERAARRFVTVGFGCAAQVVFGKT